MNGYLLDTNVISELFRKRPAPQVVAWVEAHPNLWLSVLTVGELMQGLEKIRAREPRRASAIDEWIAELAVQFHDHVLPVDDAAVSSWAKLSATRTLPAIDGLLAATAAANDLVIATRNIRDFADLGVETVNPFG